MMVEDKVRRLVDGVNALAKEVQLRSWWGIGTQTKEAAFPGYARQRVSRTDEVVFRNVPAGVTHLQLWEKETGGSMLFYAVIEHPVVAGDSITIAPNVLPVDSFH
jgi:hypothetical protein